MTSKFEDPINQIFQLKENEGEDKLTTLSDAVHRTVKPGMTLQVQWQAGAAISEILRQFKGTQPGFTLVASIFSGYLTNLVHAGLARKLIVSTCSHLYPKPGSLKPVQKAFREGHLDIEFWSLCSLQQRMQAGAQGLPFVPIRSLAGSTMAEDNRETYICIDDPFGGTGKVGLAKALIPDVSIVHCIAADRYGNAIPFEPVDESYWGPRASNSVIVTAERLVSTDFIRQHAHMVRLPGFMVDAVVVAPFGVHPAGISTHGLGEIDGYGEDFSFMQEHRQATQNEAALDAWLTEWVFGCVDHEAYLAKLGRDRIQSLVGRGLPDTCRRDMEALIDAESDSEVYNSTEMMVIAASRKIREAVLQNGYKTMQFAIGTAALSVILAYYRLRDENYGIDLISGTGGIGQHPTPPDPYLMNSAYVPTAKMLTHSVEAHSVMIGGAKNSCLSAIGAAQIDRGGNTNSTMLPDNRFMVGAGGANDAASMCSEVLVVMKQSIDKLVEEVPYISCPGAKIKTLVSDRGIFQKGPTGEFELIACYADSELTIEERVELIQSHCGWKLKVSDSLGEVEPPSRDELTWLRLLDTRKLFIKS